MRLSVRHAIVFLLIPFGAAPLIAASANLSILKSGTPDPVLPGGTISYAVTVNNEGPDDAVSALLDDPLPAGTVLANTAPVSSSTPDPSPDDASSTTFTTVGVANPRPSTRIDTDRRLGHVGHGGRDIGHEHRDLERRDPRLRLGDDHDPGDDRHRTAFRNGHLEPGGPFL
jgi:uncharacterized repeat protein (TIGR01451 family)